MSPFDDFSEPLPPPPLASDDDDDGENDDDLESLFESIKPVRPPKEGHPEKAKKTNDDEEAAGESSVGKKRQAYTEANHRVVPTKRLKPTPSQVMMERFKAKEQQDKVPSPSLNNKKKLTSRYRL